MDDVLIYVYLSLMSVAICWLISQCLSLQEKLSELEHEQRRLKFEVLKIKRDYPTDALGKSDALKEKK